MVYCLVLSIAHVPSLLFSLPASPSTTNEKHGKSRQLRQQTDQRLLIEVTVILAVGLSRRVAHIIS
jgi:hypothetical protein